MTLTASAWDQTVAKPNAAVGNVDAGPGRLLQIHPLQLSGQPQQLDRVETNVGREECCDIAIQDNSVSRHHAQITREGNRYKVTDLGSTNGTYVNEQRIETAELQPGDRVQFGSFIFKFMAANHIEMQYHEAVYSMMTRDGLTGTLNKRFFLDMINREFNKALHRQSLLCLIMLDIDHFKSVNDTHGHLAGDEVLKEVGARISRVVAQHDVFARYGGEEFAILLTTIPTDEAVDIAERCRDVIQSQPFQTSVGPLEITISMGVADFENLEDPQSEEDLIQAADAKLYEAKRGGRNRVCH